MKTKADALAELASIRHEVAEAIRDVLESGVYTLGPQTDALEREMCEMFGFEHAVAVGSGTDALTLALRCFNIGPGDKVITTPFTFAATVNAIINVGATPVFVDIDEDTLNIGYERVRPAYGSRTRAAMPVHVFGLPTYELPTTETLIEDAAHALGATVDGLPVGVGSLACCFSFHPSKPLGAYGDGGMVVTRNGEVAKYIRAMRDHGRRDGAHVTHGINSRLGEVQAAVLRVKLKHFAAWQALRVTKAERYVRLLADVPQVRLPKFHVDGRSSSLSYFVIRVERRDELKAFLDMNAVETAVYWPVPVHLMLPYQQYTGRFPVAERACSEVLALPFSPFTPDATIDRVYQLIVDFYALRGASRDQTLSRMSN